jgi:hypothetical protein
MFYSFVMYSVQYKMAVYIFMARFVSNAIVEMDQSYQLNQSNNLYINDILLPAWIIIVILWIEFFYVWVSDIVYYD